jgi:large subunit ribosomal protein L30
MAKIKIRLNRGIAGKPQRIKDTVRSLGLKKPRQVKEHEDNAVIRGMINHVAHLVEIVKE